MAACPERVVGKHAIPRTQVPNNQLEFKQITNIKTSCVPPPLLWLRHCLVRTPFGTITFRITQCSHIDSGDSANNKYLRPEVSNGMTMSWNGHISLMFPLHRVSIPNIDVRYTASRFFLFRNFTSTSN